MDLSDFDYELPNELIAQQPLDERDASRMMVVKRSEGSFAARHFSELPDLLRSGDLLVINNTRVFPARLHGRTSTGGKIEIFLVADHGANVWRALARPAKRLKPGKNIVFSEELSGEILERTADGAVLIRFRCDEDLDMALDAVGRTPLPPYIRRGPEQPDRDRDRYQTVYAETRGAIAAPTAGLHFTPEVLARIAGKGVEVVRITLHVGYGTFEPVRVNDLSRHTVAAEKYNITEPAAEQLNAGRATGKRIVAVGTTTTRALESNLARFGSFTPGENTADVTITPGYCFHAVDALLTNFHLPRSSLLILASTFGGHDLIMRAYRYAVAERYRFYSYGDCMLIV
jgi:S-adenosylmethionine:tRNA ribosyltransferase-isomerase